MSSAAALKEWSAAVHALLAGRQSVLLRKGGIGEKRFELTAREFLLFPTVAHSHSERVRPEHRDLLDVAAADSSEDHIVVRASAKVVAAVQVDRPDRIDDILDLHIWTADSVRAERLDFRPKHRLTVLVIEVRPLAPPVQLPRLAEYAGCKSWVQLAGPTTAATTSALDAGAPVHDTATLQAIAERVRRSVG